MNNSKLETLAQKERERQDGFEKRIFCCQSTACLSAGADLLQMTLEQGVSKQNGAGETAEIVRTGCMGLCSRGPLVRVEAKNEPPILYEEVTADLAKQIASHHLATDKKGAPDDEIRPHDFPHLRSRKQQAATPERLARHVLPLDSPFFTKQVRVVLSETGLIDPESLDDYLAHGGYQALAQILSKMTPEEVCDEIAESGLRGRGGAGFPTGVKWNLTRETESEEKYVIINGDEGDPGAYMDRTIMEADPHRVLEGMIICAYAVGASKGYLYIRGEYPVAIQRINKAIRSARRRKVVGRGILGTDFDFFPEVRIGAGAFVCGEETALIHSIEGQRGIPRIRPPYPSQSGLWNVPTVINNVETAANVPSIIKKGADWYASIGTEKSKGTKVFALTGQLRNTGLIEVPMGITLREIVYEMGEGVPNGRSFKAAQTGGPSGGCIPAEHLDSPVDYENLTKLGSIMGSGGLVIIDDSTQMPDFARFFIDFCVDESCGKCLPCRVGTVQIRNKLDKMIAGKGSAEDLESLERLCRTVQTASLCGLGKSAPNPVLSTMTYFRDEYESLLSDD
ncbi:NADH-ubiquinone oxidoreductase-F iron-sulfur binding region domain-containing protein [Candidatus Leptofilum sp.]|uniref:NADH-ubiquinone oxidoreductase-F iron-sulfur binding region domain-containing protein n=1 Tax=Candidatus Leptofilum sp. TaxID=3241576 RepID=UPI003B5C8F67